MKNTIQKKTEIKLDEYSNALDGLRAFAVISVIINHFDKSIMPSGFLGVDVFFVISGFVITSSLINRNEGNAKQFLIGFYKRRIKRLLPALLFCICITMLLISFFSEFPNQSIITGILAIPGFSNIYLYYNAIDYWGKTAQLNPFTHTWSLGVEEQFYMTFPLLFWLTYKRNNRLYSLKLFNTSLIVLSLISISLYIYFSQSHQMLTYFIMPFRFWEIGLGCLLYINLKNKGYYLKKLLDNIPFYLIFFLLIGLQFLSEKYIVSSTISVVILTVLIIAKIKFQEITTKKNILIIFTNPISLYLGKISYSLYLWHWVVIVISYWTIGVNRYTLIFQLVLIFILAAFSFRFIEKPLRHSSWRQSFYSKKIIYPLVGIVILFIVQIKFKPNLNFLYLGTSNQEMSINHSQTEIMNGYKMVSNCSKIRTIGNSHSLHILPMLEEITSHFNLELIHENDPDFINIPMGDQKDIDKLGEVLSVLNKDDILILSSRNRYLYEIPYLNAKGDTWINHSARKKEMGYGLSSWLNELDEVITAADKKGVKVILFLPNVEFDQRVLNPDELCKKEWFRIPDERCNPSVGIDFLKSRFSEEFFIEVYDRASEKKNFFVFDPLPIYCPDLTKCYGIVDKINAFKDTNHLTPEGSKLMLDEFFVFLTSNRLL